MIARAVVTVAAVFAVCAMTASAGTIARRERHQQARIHRGMRSGQLTPREAAGIEGQERAIQNERSQAMADGKMTHRERHAIRHDQRHASRSIWRKKHNDRTRW